VRSRAVVAGVLVAALAVACASSVSAAPLPRTAAFYLATAQQGLAQVQAHWWDAKDGWYYDTTIASRRRCRSRGCGARIRSSRR
jgi:hypothetical protein